MRTIQVNGKEVTIQSLLNTIQTKLKLVADRYAHYVAVREYLKIINAE